MNNKPSLVLLNPPSNRIMIRDNYCSKVSQAAYINHPIDLLIQSGILNADFKIHLIDAIVEKIPLDRCLSDIQAISPTAVFSLSGNVSWTKDLQFFKMLKQQSPKIKLIVSGDIFLENPGTFLEQNNDIDAILTDYTSSGMRDYLLDKPDEINQMVYRDNSAIVDTRIKNPTAQAIQIPIPLHSLFYKLDYRYPFVSRKPFATVMTEFGCPFHCSFCVMGTLGHKLRTIPNVLDELHTLSELKISDVFFLDQSFGNRQDRTITLCDAIQKHFPELRWLCFSRVDLVDEKTLLMMKNSGCHTIIFGVESANDSMLKKYRKGYDLEQVTHVFSLMKKLKLRSVATFLLGLPGETWDSACETIEFAKRLDCDFASLNIAVPRMGTDLREMAIAKGYIDPDAHNFDQSGSQVVMQTETLTSRQLLALKRKAVKDIYFRPGYLLRRLYAIKSFREFSIQFHEGIYLLKNFLTRPND